MKIKVSEATPTQLDWLVAKCEGLAMREPVPATYKDVEGLPVPFSLLEVVCTYHKDRCVRAEVKEVKVTRCGILSEVGATAPSISFTDSTGRRATGSIHMFYTNMEEAELDARQCMKGSVERHHPSTDWSQGGSIIEREGIDIFCNVPTNPNHPDTAWRGSWKACYHRMGKATPPSYGPTPLIAAMRCLISSRLGEEVEIPEELK